MKYTVVVCPEHGEMILLSDEDKNTFMSNGSCPRCGRTPKQVRSIEKETKDLKRKKSDIEEDL